MNMKTNRTVATVLTLSILGSGVAGAQMTPSTQNQPPAMDRAPAQSPMPDARQIQGTIKSVDPAKKTLTLEDGTTLRIPSSVQVAPNALKKGARVSAKYAKYEDQGGENVVTSLRVEPAPRS